MRRVVSLWLPFWPTDRLRRLRHCGLSADRPLVTRGHDGHKLVVAGLDAAARRLGLSAGLPLAQAQAMIPGLVVEEADPDGDALALARLAAWCLRLSPMTAADPPDGVWIDSTGCAHLHGGERAMLERLVGQLARQGFSAQVAAADTPGAAHALARFGEAPVCLVPPGDQARAISGLPVQALRLEAGVVDGLRRLGLERIGQLLAAPRRPLARRFGVQDGTPSLLTRLDQATGRQAEPIRPVLPPEAISRERRFVEPISTPEAFIAVIRLLVAEACWQLERRGQGARRLDLLFERVDGTVQLVRVGTSRASRAVRHLSRLLEEQVETVDPGLGVESMRLVVLLADPLGWTQQDDKLGRNLGANAPDEPDLSELVDRLANRLGPDRLYRLHLVESEMPERAQQRVPVQQPAVSAAGPRPGPAVPWPRPARLLAAPEPVQALAMLPDHPPPFFTWRRARHRVLRADGPERIHGEWWHSEAEQSAVRDYWIVETEQGRRFWLFRQGDGVDPGTGSLSWFLHGFF